MTAAIFASLAFLLMGIAAYSLKKTPQGMRIPHAISISTTVAEPRGMKREVLVAIGAITLILVVGTAVTFRAFGFPRLLGLDSDFSSRASSSPEALAKQLQDAPTAAGYKRLANMYFMAGQYDKAVSADHRAIELGANDAGTWSEFGESIVMASGGQVRPQALAAFTNAISRDPRDPRARFYIGMAEAQIGNLRQAVAIWRDLEKGADPKAKWLPMVRQHIVAFSQQGGFDPDSIAPAAPSAPAMRLAVSAMSDALEESDNSGDEGGTSAAQPGASVPK